MVNEFRDQHAEQEPVQLFHLHLLPPVRQKGGTCTSHYTRYAVLYAYVLSRIQYWASQAELGEEQLLQQLINSSDKKRITAAKKKTGELGKAEKRKAAEDNSKAKYKWLIENSPNS